MDRFGVCPIVDSITRNKSVADYCIGVVNDIGGGVKWYVVL